MRSKNLGNLLVNVVLDVQVGAVARRLGQHGLVPQVDADADLARVGVQVALSVEIKVGDVVTKIGHLSLALGSADGVRRTHVSRVEAQDVGEGDLVVHHLVLALGQCQGVEILVRPRVAGDLVALGNHALLLSDLCQITATFGGPT